VEAATGESPVVRCRSEDPPQAPSSPSGPGALPAAPPPLPWRPWLRDRDSASLGSSEVRVMSTEPSERAGTARCHFPCVIPARRSGDIARSNCSKYNRRRRRKTEEVKAFSCPRDNRPCGAHGKWLICTGTRRPLQWRFQHFPLLLLQKHQ
jgi:hypothetical protein